MLGGTNSIFTLDYTPNFHNSGSFLLVNMLSDSFPSFNLPFIFFWNAPAHKVSAVPLKTSSLTHSINSVFSFLLG